MNSSKVIEILEIGELNNVIGGMMAEDSSCQTRCGCDGKCGACGSVALEAQI